jgi:hypothetical protein
LSLFLVRTTRAPNFGISSNGATLTQLLISTHLYPALITN